MHAYRSRQETIPACKHFHQTNYNFNRDVMFTIIDQINKTDRKNEKDNTTERNLLDQRTENPQTSWIEPKTQSSPTERQSLIYTFILDQIHLIRWPHLHQPIFKPKSPKMTY
eukprot:TCONS_00015787-protein